MLDTAIAVRGGHWWVHRSEGEKALHYPPNDHRRHWHKGTIISVQDDAFAVEAGGVTYNFPMALPNTPWERLLEMARDALVCIEWRDFTVDVFRWHSTRRSILSGDGGAAQLSRPVRPGESIDFFVSHSWEDDGEAKFKEIERIAADFREENGRDPTFWLDHVCISQDNIADGLKVLPVNIMSCASFIALCGPSYLKRLWCAWELCTVTAFTPPDEVFHRIIFTPLGRPTFLVLHDLAKFDIGNCHCYDPNEEARVKRVMKAFGQMYFNSRIRRLGELIRSQMSVASW